MKLKKLAAIMAALSVSAMALTACGGTQAQAASESTQAAVESSVESSADTESMVAMEVMAESTDSLEAEASVKASNELYAATQDRVASPEWVANLPQAQDENVNQLFVVAAMGMDKTTASVSMHERKEDGTWEQILSTPGYVGKNGLCLDADHKEGCAQTPVGVYKFNKAFGIAEDPGCAMPYTQVTDDTYWSGDSREGMHYNEMVSFAEFPDLDMENSEHIVDYEYQYRYCLNISFNEDGTAGRGSAIFLHCLGPVKPYTGGCVALPEYAMKTVMTNVDPECVVVIDTLENMNGTL